MSVPIRPLVLAIVGLASPAAEAQLLVLGFKSNISLTPQDLDMISQPTSRSTGTRGDDRIMEQSRAARARVPSGC
jgi:hypothetical protein